MAAKVVAHEPGHYFDPWRARIPTNSRCIVVTAKRRRVRCIRALRAFRPSTRVGRRSCMSRIGRRATRHESGSLLNGSTPPWQRFSDADDPRRRSMLADERADLVDFLSTLTEDEWDTPSLCEGWRVRDLVTHLLYDSDPVHRYLIGAVMTGFSLRRAAVRTVRRADSMDSAERVAAFKRSVGHGLFPTIAPSVALADALVPTKTYAGHRSSTRRRPRPASAGPRPSRPVRVAVQAHPRSAVLCNRHRVLSRRRTRSSRPSRSNRHGRGRTTSCTRRANRRWR